MVFFRNNLNHRTITRRLCPRWYYRLHLSYLGRMGWKQGRGEVAAQAVVKRALCIFAGTSPPPPDLPSTPCLSRPGWGKGRCPLGAQLLPPGSARGASCSAGATTGSRRTSRAGGSSGPSAMTLPYRWAARPRCVCCVGPFLPGSAKAGSTLEHLSIFHCRDAGWN